MVETKLFKTRLCNLYQRGGCHRQHCTFAHGEAELRRFLHGDSPRFIRRDGDRKHRKRQYDDGHSDGSSRATEGRPASPDSQKEFLDEQLRKLQSEINLLDEHKHGLENDLDERKKEASSLTTKIQDLELQLIQEKEESRRITSKINKFVKAYNRQSRLEDELKRSRADFERGCEQLQLGLNSASKL